MSAHAEPAALGAFFAGSVLAGGNAVAVRFSNRELEPLWGAGLRFALAAALLAAVMVLLRTSFPAGRALVGAIVYGALTFGLGFALLYYALVELHAGLGQTLLALVPLVTLLLAVLHRQERLRGASLVGAIVALAGVAVMARAPLRESVPLLSFAAALASALCMAEATVLVRAFPRVHPVAMNAVGMATGALLLLVAALIAGESIERPQRAATWVAVGYLVAIGSVIVFVLYLFLLERWSASRASYAFVLIPVVTIALSAWLDDEPLGMGLLAGGALVLLGVYVGALRPAGAAELRQAEPVSPTARRSGQA